MCSFSTLCKNFSVNGGLIHTLWREHLKASTPIPTPKQIYNHLQPSKIYISVHVGFTKTLYLWMCYLLREVIASTLEVSYSNLHHGCLLLGCKWEYCIWKVAGD